MAVNDYSGAELQAIARYVRTPINVGAHPEFIRDERGEYQMVEFSPSIRVRAVRYTKERAIENFPLIISPSRFTDSMEMNLFLIHRYTGQYSIKKRDTRGRSELAESEATRASAAGVGANMDTVVNSAKHLTAYLRWLILNDVDWAESLSEPLNERPLSLEQLPVWQFRKELMKKVQIGCLGYDYASNRIQVIKTFYEWAWKNHRIERVPFEYVRGGVYNKSKIKTKSDHADLGNMLFGMGSGITKKGGIPIWTTTLALPRKITQKQTSPEDGLQPYSLSELTSLIESDTLQIKNYALWAELGYRCGLRAMDVVQINYEDIRNPEIDPTVQFKITLFASKGNKTRRFTLSRELMKKLWGFVNADEYAKRRVKYETKNGLESKLPIFISKVGNRISKRSVGNLTSIVRMEQRKKGLPVLARTFHDLRATFATYLASNMIEAGYSDDFIKVTLTRELGHADFDTSKKYIDFAKGDMAFSNITEPWVMEVYGPIQQMLCSETKSLIN